jgi:uncharacterized protein (TIGR03437 family)
MFIVFGKDWDRTNWPGRPVPLATSLAGTAVTVSQGRHPVRSAGLQLREQSRHPPSDTPVGLNTLTITHGGQTSTAVQFQVVRSSSARSPPILVVPDRPCPELHLAGRSALQYLSEAANPAVVTIYGTGLSPSVAMMALAPTGDLDMNWRSW